MRKSELKRGDSVVIKCIDYHTEEEIYDYGTIRLIDYEKKTAHIACLRGYKEEFEFVKFEKIIAVYNENGEMMKFGNISGKSILLED